MSDSYGDNFSNEVAKLSIEKYNKLGKSGKPKVNEWTMLSCVVQEDCVAGKTCLKVVSLGTGSKCISRAQLPLKGNVLHDSHAEVIARRAFILYLVEQIEKAFDDRESIFILDKTGFILKETTTFHLFTSHTPCGDASIVPKLTTNLSSLTCKSDNTQPSWLGSQDCPVASIIQPCTENQKKILDDFSTENCFIPSLFEKLDIQATLKLNDNLHCKDSLPKERSLAFNYHEQDPSDKEHKDIHRTGAKCMMGERTDPYQSGPYYHVTGPLRTKPGRGDPTSSHCCSDKLFKWCTLGMQGSLLMLFLKEPLYLKSITVGKCPYDRRAFIRAIHGRFKKDLDLVQFPSSFKNHVPILLQADISFPHSQHSVAKVICDAELSTSPASLVWSLTHDHLGKHDVVVGGRKLGVTKKWADSRKGRVSICRIEILAKIICLLERLERPTHESLLLMNERIFHNVPSSIRQTPNGCVYSDMNYNMIKGLSQEYQRLWTILKRSVVPNWTVKDTKLKDFTMNYF